MGDWVPRFNAQYIRPVRANIRALCEKHEADALRWANDGQVMDAFEIYRDALWFNTLRPVCSIVSQHSSLVFSNDLDRIDETHTIYVEVEDQGEDPDELAASVEKRVQAVDMIIRSATAVDLIGELDPNKTRLLTVDIPDHDYVQFQRSQTIYVQTGSFTVTVEAIEMINQPS